MIGDLNILVHRHDVGLGRFVNSYSFVGDPFAKVYIRSEFIQDELNDDGFPDSIWIGPYHLRKAGEPRFARLDCPYMLDAAFWRTERLIESVDRFLRIFKGRLIMTLHIWNLANVPAYAEPSWCHVGKHWR